MPYDVLHIDLNSLYKHCDKAIKITNEDLNPL